MNTCDLCGRTTETVQIIEGEMDPETGYVESEAMCGDCYEKNGANWNE